MCSSLREPAGSRVCVCGYSVSPPSEALALPQALGKSLCQEGHPEDGYSPAPPRRETERLNDDRDTKLQQENPQTNQPGNLHRLVLRGEWLARFRSSNSSQMLLFGTRLRYSKLSAEEPAIPSPSIRLHRHVYPQEVPRTGAAPVSCRGPASSQQ